MEPPRDDQLIAELQALRPTPRAAFAAELDERAAAGFPRRRSSRIARSPLAGWIERLRALPPKRLLLPAGGVAVAALVASTALIVSSGGESTEQGASAPSSSARGNHAKGGTLYEGHNEKLPSSGAAGAAAATAEGGSSAESAPAEIVPFDQSVNARLRHRDVERSAEITLGAKPEDVADDATKVFETVRAHRGIVMRSSTSQGKPGEAGASFELLIPSRELGAAMGAFSEIDAVRSRHEATADITAPTVGAAELLKESRARIDSLLGELEAAETEAEREVVEAELRHERRRSSRLAAQLTHLHRRADYSRVYLRIVTGGRESSGGGAWGFDNALHDAGHILTVAAAVLLIALAVLGPIALIALLAWLTHRTWVRRERRRALG